MSGIQAPHNRLNPSTLRALEVDPETKIIQVMRQLKKGAAAIVYDEKSETCNIALCDEPKGRS